MKWSVSSGMPLSPNCCTACGNTPQGEDGPRDAVFAEGVDVDWGNSLYLCETCVRIVGQLMGMEVTENVRALQDKYDALGEDHEELEEKYEKLRNLVDRMRDGASAKKTAKELVKK